MRVMQRPRLLTPRPDWGLSTRQQRSLTTHASAAYTFSGRNPLALWTGRGGEMQVERRPMLPTGRDGAQRVTRHFPTWRDGCDEDMSGIRIVRSLRRTAQFASRQCSQKAACSPRGLLCKRRRGSLLCCDHLCVWLCGRLPRYSLFRHRRTELRQLASSPGHCRRLPCLRRVSLPSAWCVASRCPPVHVDKHRHGAVIVLR